MTTGRQRLIEAADKLRAMGWTFDFYSFAPAKGWWILPDSNDPVKANRRGDPKSLFESALTTIELYCQG